MVATSRATSASLGGGAALDKIGTASPALGRHLGAAIVTGYFCAYQPPRGTPCQWRLSPSTTA
jgi:hypothetical protein